MEDLIADIQEKTGLSADKVLEVVTMVADYMKNALPEELVDKIATYLGEAASSPGDSASDVWRQRPISPPELPGPQSPPWAPFSMR